MFLYNSYWRNWSRVLSTNHPNGPFVEVNLTPINSWANDVSMIRIRLHGTARDPNDKLVENLPHEIELKMVMNLGVELTARLLTEDFLPQIDWELYKKKCNGGANLEDIKRR